MSSGGSGGSADNLQENGTAPVSPSAIRAATKTFVNNNFVDVSETRALETDELPGIVNDFRQAAANAIAPPCAASFSARRLLRRRLQYLNP
jgi:2,4-dienoyl-CoA reductase-like NADH-dependent reductase (Old Yellow Enzyme family)